MVSPSEAIEAAIDALHLARLIGSISGGRIWASRHLSQALKSAITYAQDASGVLAISLSQQTRDYLMFFRKEIIQTLK